MAVVYLPDETGVTINCYGSSSYVPTGHLYTVRFAVEETAVSDTESTYTLKLQCKNNASAAWWSGTVESRQPELVIFVDGTAISFKSPGASTASTTGYFRTAAQAYTASSSWFDLITVTDLTTTNTVLNPASITIGFETTAGSGTYSGPLGPAACSADTATTYKSTYDQTYSFMFRSMCTANTTNGVFTKKVSPINVNVAGTWKNGIPWVKIDSTTWKQGTAWVKVDNSNWKTKT